MCKSAMLTESNYNERHQGHSLIEPDFRPRRTIDISVRKIVPSNYAVALCNSCPPSRTLTSFDTPGSCMVTP
jgi:hypothetical protein